VSFSGTEGKDFENSIYKNFIFLAFRPIDFQYNNIVEEDAGPFFTKNLLLPY
jgi:hypothetical protein